MQKLSSRPNLDNRTTAWRQVTPATQISIADSATSREFCFVRTTIDLDGKALKAAKSKSLADGISLDKAISALVLKGASSKAPPQRAVFKSKGGQYTSADVSAALESD